MKTELALAIWFDKRPRLGIVVIVVITFVICYAAFAYKPTPMPAQKQEKISQVSDLHRKDLIVFDDNRVWLVRADSANGDLRIVEWAGNAVRELEIQSFVGGNDKFKVVRRTDPEWSKYIDRFLDQ